jgi:DNA-directed RNA polymerase specialized sigma24 family protein
MTDGQLLASYLTDRSTAALDQLVKRHAPMVYATCLRVISDRRLAEEATHAVFLMLIRQRRRLRGEQVLCGWLHAAAYRTACYALERDQAEEVFIETSELAAVD